MAKIGVLKVVKRVFYVIFLVLILLTNYPAFAKQQHTTTTKPSRATTAKHDNSRQRLVDAQIKAQTECLNEQRKLAEEQQKDVADGRAPLFGILHIRKFEASILTGIGAILAALVAFLTFIFTYRSSRRDQRNTQFYEALKRFGDQESPTLRTSAAGLLVQMAQRKEWSLWPLPHRTRPYFTTALEQLMAGLQLETDPVVIATIQNVSRSMVEIDAQVSMHILLRVNRQLQYDMVDIQNQAVSLWKDQNWQMDDLWNEVALTTGYSKEILYNFYTRYHAFLGIFHLTLGLYQTKNKQLPLVPELPSTIEKRLCQLGAAMRMNVALIIAATQTCALNIPSKCDIDTIFLAEANITTSRMLIGLCTQMFIDKNFASRAISDSIKSLLSVYRNHSKLSQFVSLSKRLCCKAGEFLGFDWGEPDNILVDLFMKEKFLLKSNLCRTFLDGADLSLARMPKASLSGASLYRTILYGIQITKRTDLSFANWWDGVFISDLSDEPDLELLEILYGRYGKFVPDDLSSCTDVVRDFIEKKRKEDPMQKFMKRFLRH